jgi:hypothetical protein
LLTKQERAIVANTVKPLTLTLDNQALLECRIPMKFWNTGVNDYFGRPQAMKQIQQYVLRLNSALTNGTGLFFRGEMNTGKTFLITLTLKSVLAMQISVAYFTLDELIESNLGNLSSLERFSPKFYKTPLVAIDQIQPPPTHKHSSEVYTQSLRRLLQHRKNDGLPTLFATRLIKDGETDFFRQQYGDEVFELVTNSMVTVKCDVDQFEMARRLDKQKAEVTAVVDADEE